MAERRVRAQPGRAFHYRDTGSSLHRLGAGWKLALTPLACAAAVGAETPLALVVLLVIVALGYAAARLGVAELWQDARWVALQGGIVIVLYVLRDGIAAAGAGLHTALQLALFFLPGALLLRTTPVAGIVHALQRLLPQRLAFAAATSLRFLPYFAREAHEIVAAQRLRGAHLALRELWRPAAWRDWVECVGVPLVVRAIHTANEAALAAEVRGLARKAGT